MFTTRKIVYPRRLFSAPLLRWPQVLLLPMHLEALTSNATVANRRPSAVRRIVGSRAKNMESPGVAPGP